MTELFIGAMTQADAERIRALILPDDLPRIDRCRCVDRGRDCDYCLHVAYAAEES